MVSTCTPASLGKEWTTIVKKLRIAAATHEPTNKRALFIYLQKLIMYQTKEITSPSYDVL
jgi:hypothetical protein